MMGGYGYASEYDMESSRAHRRSSRSIYGGTNEVQREIVSKTAGSLSSFGAGRNTIRFSSVIVPPPRRIAV